MTKRMLIDATHAEETRVVVLDGNRLEDFDVETSTKRQLKGNIYLAKVVRVEPSLQAAFVEYGGNRHGFLAFSEIHPDYYQIPVADRQRLIEMQAEEARREEEEADLELALGRGTDQPGQDNHLPDVASTDQPNASSLGDASATDAFAAEDAEVEDWARPSLPLLIAPALRLITPAAPAPVEAFALGEPAQNSEPWATPELPLLLEQEAVDQAAPEPGAEVEDQEEDEETDSFGSNVDHIGELPPPETMGGDQDSGDDQRERRLSSRFMRNYKIQEVIRRRQILLIQVVKEERGTKGAALTTYLSLAGRFGVLMPNSPRGGGISRKITSAADRRRLKEVMAELDIPRGMGMIVRTAGANRPKPEIKRDCEYLLRLWDDIRDHTMKSVAPALIYEEASLIKRAIRDVYSRDIDEILVDGEAGWRAAHDFMRMLMPSHAKKVQLWRDGGQPLFARQQVESQLDGMLIPTVQLRSGGYLVINQAEALVAIDVNSGRSTRERNIEETALRTNLEAADEVARQLRLRDLAGLIVIDFIDMESKRHNAMVERRMKEALKNDRARIQVGHISHFGLLEMSRQRLRPSLAETSFMPCPHCGGTGHVRSTENAAIHVLRGIEDEGSRLRAAEVVVHVSTPVALYLLNHKRERLQEIELRYVMRIIIAADDAQIAPQFRVERVRLRSADEIPAVIVPDRVSVAPPVQEAEPEEEEDAAAASDEDEEIEEDVQQPLAAATGEAGGETSAEEAERRRRKRRRRRRGGRREEVGIAVETAEQPLAALTEAVSVDEGIVLAVEVSDPDPIAAEASGGPDAAEGGEAAPGSDEDLRNRRRGRRGGRRRRRDEGDVPPFAVPGAEQPDLLPTYAGPTPADPFGGRAFDIFDVMDQAERQAEATPPVRAASAAEIVNASGPGPEDAMVDAASNEPPSTPVPTQEAAPSIATELARPATEILNATAPESAAEPSRIETEAPAEAKHPAEPEGLAEPGWMANDGKLADPESPASIENPANSERLADPESLAEPAWLAEPEKQAQGVGGTSETAVPTHPVPTPANDVQADVSIPESPPGEPAIKPILVGAGGDPPAERKRGWWRR